MFALNFLYIFHTDYKEINEVAAKNIKSNEKGNELHSSDMDENSSFLDDNEESQFMLDKDVDYDYYLSGKNINENVWLNNGLTYFLLTFNLI